MKPDAARAELIKADEQWARAWAARDLSGVVLYFHEDAVVVTPAHAATGKRDIINVLAGAFRTPGFATRLEMTRAEAAAGGDLGYTLGTYQTTVTDVGGKPVTHSGHYLAAWKKGADRTWKIAAYSGTPVREGA